MSARPGGNLAADTVKTAAKAAEEKSDQWTVSATFCRGCRYLGRFGGHMPYCDYAGVTGRPRTARRGKKVDMCPRKRKSAQPAGGH